MKKVAGYGRVSTPGRVKEGTSLEDQEETIKEKCKIDGYDLVKFYSDEGISGGSLDRPALKELIEDAKTGKFEAILFTKLDRLGRSVRDIHNFWHTLNDELGVDLICIHDPSLNTAGKMGKALLTLISLFAELERDMIRERTQAGKSLKREKGEIVAGELPFGYQKDKASGKPVTVERQAAIYEKIVNYYLDLRMSTKQIAIRLTSEGIETPSVLKKKKKKSLRWNSIAIADMLKNPAYKGEAVYNKDVYEWRKGNNNRQYMSPGKQTKPKEEWALIKFPPLVSEEKWQQIQDRIQQQRHKPKRIYREYENHFLLDGFIYCGECGGRMRKRVKKEKNGKVRLDYTCFWRGCSKEEKELAGRSSCYMESVDADTVDDKLYDEIIHLMTEPNQFAEAWLRDLNVEELSDKVNNLEKRDRQLRQSLSEGFKLIAGATNPELKLIYRCEQKDIEDAWNAIQPEINYHRLCRWYYRGRQLLTMSFAVVLP